MENGPFLRCVLGVPGPADYPSFCSSTSPSLPPAPPYTQAAGVAQDSSFRANKDPQKMTPTPQEFLIFRGRLFSGQGRGETWWACVGSKGHNPGGRSDGGGCVHRHRGLLGTRLGPGPFPGRPTRPGAPDLLQGEEKELLGQQLRVQQQLRIRTAATAHIPRHRRRQETPGRLPTSLRGGSVPEVTYRAGTQACRHAGCAAHPAPPFAAVRVLGWLSLGVAPPHPPPRKKGRRRLPEKPLAFQVSQAERERRRSRSRLRLVALQ